MFPFLCFFNYPQPVPPYHPHLNPNGHFEPAVISLESASCPYQHNHDNDGDQNDDQHERHG